MSDKNAPKCGAKYSGIGGQAVMEGVMMRNAEKYAVAVRKSDGTIEVLKDEYRGLAPSKAVYKIPFIRGVFSFIDSLILGMKALNYSAEFFTEDEESSENSDSTVLTSIIMIVAILIAVALFMVLPYFLSLLFHSLTDNAHVLALLEGLIRLCIFIIYVLSISRAEDIRRVFMYHGAEHKCINCIENGLPLTLENVRASSRQHRRCGTSFLLYVMVISILFFTVIQTPDRLMKIVLRVVLIPVIAGVSFEFIRLAGSSNNALVRLLSVPGLLMQTLTTKEPDDDMIEVGIASVEAVFDWKKYIRETFG